jgi:hypothetical protein
MHHQNRYRLGRQSLELLGPNIGRRRAAANQRRICIRLIKDDLPLTGAVCQARSEPRHDALIRRAHIADPDDFVALRNGRGHKTQNVVVSSQDGEFHAGKLNNSW